MANFEQAINLVLKHEGGFVNHAADPGGATNYGVSLRFLKSTGQLHDYDFDGDGDIDADDIKKMTPDNAREIYKTHWWDKYGYERIRSNAIATKLLDMAVNMGQKQAVKLMQCAAKKLYGGDQLFTVNGIITPSTFLAIDGVMGPATINAINPLSPEKLLAEMRVEQAAFYDSLIRSKPALAVFRNGWQKRAYA